MLLYSKVGQQQDMVSDIFVHRIISLLRSGRQKVDAFFQPLLY